MADDPAADPAADEAFNMSMRKFLKQVGVTSQQAIEAHVRDNPGLNALPVRVVLTAPGGDGGDGGEGGDLEHVVEGEIKLG